MKMIRLYILLLPFIAMTGCEDFLAEEPDMSTPIKTIEELEGILNDAFEFAQDEYCYFLAFSTDNAYLNPEYNQIFPINFYTFSWDQIKESTGVELRSYGKSYNKILKLNTVLEYVDVVTGDESRKREVKAEAHFLRAYTHWFLANTYCLPYAPGKNGNELGLTLRKTSNWEESVKRSTLKETYDFILDDLNEAMKTTRDDVDPQMRFRVSKKAVTAFLSRVHLFMGNYDEALTHTNNALASTSTQLMDLHTMNAGTVFTFTNPDETITFPETTNWRADTWLNWEEFYFPRAAWVISPFLISPDLVSLYDQENDLRFKWFMLDFKRWYNTPDPLYGYGGGFWSFSTTIPSGPTRTEMLLNKAEILARKGDVAGAMATVNTLREKYMDTPAPLTATGKDDAIKKVLDERRKELPFSMRWYDIRRFGVNDYPADDVTVTRTWWKVADGVVDRTTTEVYTMEPDSRKWALPIPSSEIFKSDGVVEQNQY